MKRLLTVLLAAIALFICLLSSAPAHAKDCLNACDDYPRLTLDMGLRLLDKPAVLEGGLAGTFGVGLLFPLNYRRGHFWYAEVGPSMTIGDETEYGVELGTGVLLSHTLRLGILASHEGFRAGPDENAWLLLADGGLVIPLGAGLHLNPSVLAGGALSHEHHDLVLGGVLRIEKVFGD